MNFILFALLVVSLLFVSICSLCLALDPIGEGAQSKQLRFVQAIWRHGDRAPKNKSYNNDPYDEKYWPRGWNQLTYLGMQQMKELGEFFRQRYIRTEFIPTNFKRDLVFIQSSESDRALESAQSFTLGLYPPGSDELAVDGNLKFLPVPIHSSGLGVADPLLKTTNYPCPEYKHKYSKIRKELEQQSLQYFSELTEFLKDELKLTNEMTFKELLTLSNIKREVLHNLTQPDWVFRRWPSYENKTTLELIVGLQEVARNKKFSDPELSFFRGGFVLGEILNTLRKKTTNSSFAEKMHLYSSHDGTILALLYSLGLADGKAVPYAGCLIFELYETGKGKFSVEIYYRTEGELKQLEISGCTKSCPMDKVFSIYKKKTIFLKQDLCEKCGSTNCECETTFSNKSTRPLVGEYLIGFLLLCILSISSNSLRLL